MARSFSPSARRSASACFHLGGFHIYGGFGAAGAVNPDAVFADLWRFSDGGWMLIAKALGPGARYPTIFSSGDSLWRYGGCGWDGSRVTFESGVGRLDVQAAQWCELSLDPNAPRPPGRYTAAGALFGDALFVFGGHSQKANGAKINFGDLWRLCDGRWTRMHGPESGPGANYGFGWCTHEDGLYVATGYDGGAERADLWRLDLKSTAAGAVRWDKLASAGPPPRYCPAFGMTSAGLALFGGRRKTDPKCNYSDTWIFDLADLRWRRFAGAGPIYHAKPAYASDGMQLMLFGGEGPRGHLSDLWSFDGARWSQLHKGRRDDPILW